MKRHHHFVFLLFFKPALLKACNDDGAGVGISGGVSLTDRSLAGCSNALSSAGTFEACTKRKQVNQT